MSVEEIGDRMVQVDTGILAANAVFFTRIIHAFKRNSQVLQVFVKLGAIAEQYIIVGHAVINQQIPA